jgi:hypothetical protein
LLRKRNLHPFFGDREMTSLQSRTSALWLRSPAWDLTWISLSAVLALLPYASFYIGRSVGLNPDDSRNAVNILVAFCIGGPHMYATHTRTTFDPQFRAAHSSLRYAAFVIPFVVFYLGMTNFILLLTIFFLWASVHVLHQIVFIVDCYHNKDARERPRSDRMIDYAVVLSALYPIAMYRFVHGTFHVGSNYLYFPAALRHDIVWMVASAVFALALTLFISKSIREIRAGELNAPKTILILITIFISFITPAFNELDVAFQGMNTWHSFQYLGLIWYINRLRMERGEIQTPAMRKLSAKGNWWRYYGFNVLLNSTSLIPWGLLVLTSRWTGVTWEQAYYMVVLCFLWTHYYHDHILFRMPEQIAGPARVRSSGDPLLA